MNPSGIRMEEKKSAEGDRGLNPSDSKSTHSYKSTHSSRSSVLERAREYNRRIEEQSRRSKSLERSSDTSSRHSASTPRSKSASRLPQQGNRISTRERALASVRKEATSAPQRRGQSQSTENTQPLTPHSHYSSHVNRPSPTTPKRSTPSAKNGNNRRISTDPPPKQPKASPSRSMNSRSVKSSQKEENPEHAIVTPELLVDALSGHEDGLLAIAERLMEHYDSGYDVMGEAIIDAFADVQKLFQHVVEAAHMEGAAFEASRREQEMAELRRQAAAGELAPAAQQQAEPQMEALSSPNGGPNRHDEFIDQDVKDVLTEAIRKGASLREGNKHMECYDLYEQACQSASALLPVDSDHRGRLQLSIARAESMSADRACAILRYAMDDVLRSGMRAGRTPLPDPSKRADVVLSKPKGHPSMSGVTGQAGVVQSSDEALASLIEEMKEILGAPVYNDTPLQTVARRFWSALNDAQKTQHKNEERLEQNLGKLKGDFLLAKAEWEEKLNQSTETADTYKEKYEKLKEQVKSESYMEQARSVATRMNEGEDISTIYGSVRSATSHRAGSVASLGSGLAQQAKTIVQSMNNFNCSGMNERNSPMVNSEDDVDDLHEVDTRFNGSERRSRSRSKVSSKSPQKISGSSGRTGSSGRSRSNSRNQSFNTRSFREYSKSPQRIDV